MCFSSISHLSFERTAVFPGTAALGLSYKVHEHTARGESHTLGADPGPQSREVLKPSRSKGFCPRQARF